MTSIHPSVCPLDCPDTCSLSVTVDQQRVTRVRGSRVNPLTRGSICAKVAHYPELIHGAGRLTTPLARTGPKGAGEFRKVSWDDALDRIHERFSSIVDRWGGEAITPLNYAGPHGVLAGGSMDLRFFHRLGASRLQRESLCGGIRGTAYTATFGNVPGARPDDVSHARLIIVWGNNVTVSNLHLKPLISIARRRGAKLVVVDPRRIPIARHADLHIALRPGTDVLLAFALAAELERIGGVDEAFVARHVHGAEAFLAQARRYSAAQAAAECGIDAEMIRVLARWYRDSEPAVICPGNGAERNRNGGSGFRALYALPALAGKFGVRGGGLVQGASRSFPTTDERLAGTQLLRQKTRTLNIVTIARTLLNRDLKPPIEGVFVYNHNPAVVHPDQNTMLRALAQEELFTVVCDIVRTDTVAYADIVLPAASHFEHADIYASYGNQYLQRAEAVIAPVGQALPNTEIFRRLAARFGFDEPELRADDRELMNDAFDGADARMQGYAPSDLPLELALPMKFGGRDAVLTDSVAPTTPSGRIELESDWLAQEYDQPVPGYRRLESQYPLWLVTPSSDQRTTSTFGGLSYSDDTWLDMHPDDAAERGLAGGEQVRVFNELGEIRIRLRVTDKVRSGVVSSPKGAWRRTSPDGRTVSALAPTHLADLCQGACYNDARVEVTGTK